MLQALSADPPAFLAEEIAPPHESFWAYLRQTWRNRQLFAFLAGRVFRYRTKGAILGSFWVVFRSVTVMLPLCFVLGSIAGGAVEGVPYTVFLLFGLCFWNYFVSVLMFATRALRIDRDLPERFGFPRLLVVLATPAPLLLELACSLVMAYVVTCAVAWHEGRAIVFVNQDMFLVGMPVLLGMTTLGLGLGMVTCILNNYARDVRFMLPQAVTLWMFATPILYPLTHVEGMWQTLLKLNPLTTYAEGFRLAFMGVGQAGAWMWLYTILVTGAVFLFGAWFFHRATTRPLAFEVDAPP